MGSYSEESVPPKKLDHCRCSKPESNGRDSKLSGEQQLCRRLSAVGLPSKAVSPVAHAIVYEQHGPPDQVIRIAEVPPRELAENEVCVRMLAAPINPSDINKIEGVYPIKPVLPAIGGFEGVGEVHAIGSAVGGFSVGDWVIACPLSFGTWQTYIVKDAGSWHKVSKNIPIEYSATIIVNPLSAYLMLKEFVELKSGDTIVQNGATSIVGQCIIQLAKVQGIRTINIIRDRPGYEEVEERLYKLGADLVFTESQLKLKNIKSLLGDLPEPAVGLNCVGGDAATYVQRFLRYGGTMVTYGGMSKKPITVSTSAFIFKDLSLRGFWLHKSMGSERANELRPMIDYLLNLVQIGELKYDMELAPFDDFALAMDKAIGKLGSQPKQVIRF